MSEVVYNKDVEALEARLGLKFVQISLLEQALTHSSFVNEYPELGAMDNQRLEFLGDAILDFLVGEWLFMRYPELHEGELTALRAHIVRTESLAGFSQEIGVGPYLRLGKGEASSGGHERSANLCAAFEALAGAIYLDQGIAIVRTWTARFLEAHAIEIDGQRTSKDAKSQLQEYSQRMRRLTPSYRIVREEGPDHAKMFTAEALIGQEVWGRGTGSSKQAAEQEAAADALRARAIG